MKFKARWCLPDFIREIGSEWGNIRCFMINVVQINWRKLLPEKIWQKNWDQKTACFTTEDINSKYAQGLLISNCLQYKLTFSVTLNRYLQFLVRKPRKVDLLRSKLKSSPPSWKKFLLSLNAPACLAFPKFTFAFASHQWTRFYMQLSQKLKTH